MNATMSVTQIMDTIQECLIVKSGMYLDYGEIKNILEDLKDDLSKFLLNSDEAQFYRLRPEEIEYVINNIRQNIGELPDNNHFSIMSLLIKYPEFQDEMMRAVKKLTPCMDWHIKAYGSEKPLGDEFINKFIQESGISKRVAELVFLTIFNSLDRSFSYMQPTKNWNGIVALSDLFNSEKLPALPDIYFDQRYIDYLSNNTDDLYRINWRQFEGLTTEFFSRNGFKVKIGPGRNDGGIDIYATHMDTNDVIIIQCKRYSKDNQVEVNAVKALYFDIIDKGVNGALIATTSHLSPSGKDIVALNYPISAAEHENIIEWVKSMKSNML